MEEEELKDLSNEKKVNMYRERLILTEPPISCESSFRYNLEQRIEKYDGLLMRKLREHKLLNFNCNKAIVYFERKYNVPGKKHEIREIVKLSPEEQEKLKGMVKSSVKEWNKRNLRTPFEVIYIKSITSKY